MYLLEKEKNIIMHITETLERQEINNYYLIKNGTIAVPPEFVENLFEVQELPEYVEEEKYCYTEEKGFFKNEDYEEIQEENEENSDKANQIL